MDATSLSSAIRKLVENWPFWIVFAACLVSVIQPRWFWDENEHSSEFHNGRKAEPSALWLLRTRVAGLIFMAMVVVVLCYGLPER